MQISGPFPAVALLVSLLLVATLPAPAQQFQLAPEVIERDCLIKDVFASEYSVEIITDCWDVHTFRIENADGTTNGPLIPLRERLMAFRGKTGHLRIETPGVAISHRRMTLNLPDAKITFVEKSPNPSAN